MLRSWRNEGQEIVVRPKGSRDPEDYISVKVCTVDPRSGNVQVGISASQKWLIYRAESPRDTEEGATHEPVK